MNSKGESPNRLSPFLVIIFRFYPRHRRKLSQDKYCLYLRGKNNSLRKEYCYTRLIPDSSYRRRWVNFISLVIILSPLLALR